MTEEESRNKGEEDELGGYWDQDSEANHGFQDLISKLGQSTIHPPALKPLTEPTSLRPASWYRHAKAPEVMEVDVNHPSEPPKGEFQSTDYRGRPTVYKSLTKRQLSYSKGKRIGKQS